MKMPKNKAVRIFLGIVCMLLWIMGAVLPVIPGIPFLIIGLILFGVDVRKHIVKHREHKWLGRYVHLFENVERKFRDKGIRCIIKEMRCKE